MEIIAAAFAPCLALWILARRSGTEFRKASPIFILLTVLWFAPCWLFNRSPVSFDYLATEPPWKILTSDGKLVRNPLLNDIPLQILPWREAARTAINSGHFPFLNRSSAAGSALWENPQVCVLYPVQLLGHFFTSFAFPLFSATSKVLLALCGTFLFLRALGNSYAAAVFGAIGYAFSCFTVAYLLFPVSNVTILLPLLLYFLLRTARETRWTAVVGGSVVLGAMLLGGHPESVLHSSLVAIPLGIRWMATTERRASLLLRYAVIGLLGFALAAPVMLPFLNYVPVSQRLVDIQERPGFLSTAPFELASFVPFVMPNYFGNPRVHNYRHSYNFNDLATQYAGLSVLALALAALLIEPRRHWLELVLLIAATMLAITPPALQKLVSSIPLLDITAHSKLRFVIALLLVILAARGFDLLVGMSRPGLFLAIAATLFGLVTAIALLSYPVFAQFGIRRLIFFTEIAALLSVAWVARVAYSRRPETATVLWGLLFLDLFSIVGFYNAAVSRDFYYPLTPGISHLKSSTPPYRFLGLGQALMPNSAVFHRLEDIRVHDPLAFRPYVQFLEKAGMDRSGYFAQFRQPPPRNLLDFLGVRFLITAPGEQWAGVAPAYSGPDATVYANPAALPRFFIPSQVVVSTVPADDFLASSSALNAFAVQNSPAFPGTVRLHTYNASGSRIEVITAADTTVATSEVALPGWKLQRDGKPWPTFVINGSFLAWQVPAGNSVFDLTYRPPGLVPGMLLSLFAVAALLGIGIFTLRTGVPGPQSLVPSPWTDT